MKLKGIRPNVSIRINPDVLHQAKVAAVMEKMTLGQWLEEAIQEKIRNTGGNNVSNR